MSATVTTLANLLLDVGNLLADSSGARWSQAISPTPTPSAQPLQYYLSEAADEFCRLTGIYRASASVTVTAGTQTVTVADGNGNPPFGPLLRLEDQSGRALIKTSAHALDVFSNGNWKGAGSAGIAGQGQPERYIRGLDGFGTLRLIPTPSVSTTFTAYFVARPKPMTDGSHYPFSDSTTLTADNPAHYHYALPYYAAYKALLFNQDTKNVELAQFFKAQFDSIVKSAMAEVSACMDA